MKKLLFTVCACMMAISLQTSCNHKKTSALVDCRIDFVSEDGRLRPSSGEPYYTLIYEGYDGEELFNALTKTIAKVCTPDNSDVRTLLQRSMTITAMSEPVTNENGMTFTFPYKLSFLCDDGKIQVYSPEYELQSYRGEEYHEAAATYLNVIITLIIKNMESNM